VVQYVLLDPRWPRGHCGIVPVTAHVVAGTRRNRWTSLRRHNKPCCPRRQSVTTARLFPTPAGPERPNSDPVSPGSNPSSATLVEGLGGKRKSARRDRPRNPRKVSDTRVSEWHFTESVVLTSRYREAYHRGVKHRKNKALGGGARRNRTADLFNAIEALSQLSYDPGPNFLWITPRCLWVGSGPS
jgi:hypothetical protein